MSNRVVCIYGGTGSGKSTLAKMIIKRLPKVVVMDPMNEYKGPGWRSAHDVASLSRAMAAQWAKGPVRVSLNCPGGNEETAGDVAELIWKAQATFPRDPRELTFVIDEANMFYPNKQNLPAALNRVTLQGRHRGINLLVITQRPSRISTDLRGQATQVNAFQLPGPHDRKAVEDICEGVGDAVRALSKYQFVRVEGASFEAYKTLKSGSFRKIPVRT